MSTVSLGDLAQSFILRRQSLTLKSDIQTLSTELVTGISADKAARLSGDFVPMAAIEASLARLSAYDAVTSESGLFAGAIQTALTTIDEMSSDLGQSLLSASTSSSPTRINAVGYDANQRFESAISVLNTRFGDRSLFAGVATSGAALVDAQSIMAALDVVTAGALTAADVETAISNWFDAPGGFESTAYLGGPAMGSLPISPGESARIDVTALDPAIRATLKGLATAAMLNRGILPNSPEARADLAKRSAERLLESQTDRALLSARLGTTESQIGAASVRNSSESTALQLARLAMTALDPYETASTLEQRQTQLETLFAITSRMTRLSLVDYLR